MKFSKADADNFAAAHAIVTTLKGVLKDTNDLTEAMIGEASSQPMNPTASAGITSTFMVMSAAVAAAVHLIECQVEAYEIVKEGDS